MRRKRKLDQWERAILSPAFEKKHWRLFLIALLISASLIVLSSGERALAADVAFVYQISQYSITYFFF